jgi:predicted Zn-dependent protease
MRMRLVLGCAASVIGCACALLRAADSTAQVRSDVQLRAMLDELKRSKTLQLNNLDKPYFIEYVTSDGDNLNLSASLGGLLSSSRVHVRLPRVQVRVGDYKFDNTNSIYTGSARLGLFPLDDDYSAMRADLWLSTDGLYKASTDQITRKRTALREIAEPDNTPDLAPAKPMQIIRPVTVLNIGQQHWEDSMRSLSGIFAEHPAVTNSGVRLRAISTTYRLVNTEGTIVRIPEEMTDFSVFANALAPDGSRVWNHDFVTVVRASELPSENVLRKTVEDVASETERLSKAPVGEDYSGPILFEGEAAAEMMAQVLTDAIRLQRKPLAPPGSDNRALNIIESVWAPRVGSKVLPDWLSIIDDPLETQFDGTPLAGRYEVDDEGVPAQAVTIVDKGTLKGFLFSRQPINTFNASNGHGRLPGGYGSEAAVIGNLFVKADQSISEAELKNKFLQKVKTAGLKYGLIIKRMDFPSTATYQELESMARQLEKSGYARTLNTPILVYRAYPDGREELVRNLRFREFSAKDLRDIDAASNRPFVLNYVNNGSSFNWTQMQSDATTSSIICPSLLFDSVDLAKAEQESNRLPIVSPPALIAQH